MNLRGLLGGLIVLVLLGGVGTLLVDPFDDGDDVAANADATSTSTSAPPPSTTTATTAAPTTAAPTTGPDATAPPTSEASGPPTTQLTAPPPAEEAPRGAPSGTADGELAFTGGIDGAAIGLAGLALALAMRAGARRSTA